MRLLNDTSKLELLVGMIINLEREYSAEVHAGFIQNAGKIRGKLIPLYQGKNILTERLQRRNMVNRMFETGAKCRIGA